MRFLFITLIAGFVIACESTPAIKKGSLAWRTPGRMIEKQYAEYRAELISDVHYDFQFNLTQPDFFTGTSKATFKMASAQETTLDFFEGTVQSLKINNRNVKVDHNGYFIRLPKDSLKTGVNIVEVQFKHGYSPTGSGLYRYEDPADKNAYLYTDFEPYDANALAPMFDQPDIKATYQSTVIAPKNWTVITSTRESKVEEVNGFKQWTFPASEAFSTYVYSLHAGPYKMWTSQVKTPYQTIPLRLFARQSLAKHVDPKEWFSTTQQGFQFFEKYFETPYPYKKYDQVIVPDFNSGAMENVAAVTFNETRFVTRGQKQRAQKRRLAEVILHEMAHMWFGDLVTMKWWNDIWLNESFATYAATLALTEGTPYKDSWVDFNTSEKRGAYHADQLTTTHPIEFEVANTDVVFANFDAITYGKGASVLKQLAFYIGPKTFQKGLQDYFKRYAGGNTTLTDFIAALERAHGKELQSWKQKWLQTANVNTMEVKWSCKAGKVSQATLEQTSNPGFEVLRPHKTQIAVFGEKKGTKLLKTIDLEYSQASTPIAELKGMSCDEITLIYPNYNDQDYAKVHLDEKSLQTTMDYLSRQQDELLRSGLWGTVWDLVLDQKLPATEYLRMVYLHAKKETSLDTLSGILGRGFGVVRKYFPQDNAWKDARNRLARDLTTLCYEAMVEAPTADLQKVWFDAYVDSVEVEKDQQIILGYLKKTPAFLKFKIDQDRRWNILQSLNRNNPSLAKAYVDAERAKDSTYEGQQAALETLALTPDLAVKKELWGKITQGPSKENPLGKLRPVMSGIFPYNQENLQAQFKDDFYKEIKALKAQPPEYLRPLADLAPTFCTTDSVSGLRSFIEDNGDLPPSLQKNLKIHAQEDERCVGIRAKIKTARAI
ncbi:MAG: aminopeptidase N [Bdellovibrionales bacterium]|nr:aminopeptidase N [Bdellovibrionales bacterium]